LGLRDRGRLSHHQRDRAGWKSWDVEWLTPMY
jgi:hypothetical protein